MRVFHFVIKKKEKGPETGFLWWFWHIFKYFYSNHNLSSCLLFSKCFSWLFYLGVHRGTGVFFVVLFFTPPLARDSLSRSPRACLRLTEKRWKIAPLRQIQASSMKLRIHGFFFLVFLHIQTDGNNKLFFYNHINIKIRRFFSELVESNSLGKYSLIMIRIGMNTALLALSLGM